MVYFIIQPPIFKTHTFEGGGGGWGWVPSESLSIKLPARLVAPGAAKLVAPGETKFVAPGTEEDSLLYPPYPHGM